MNSFKHAIIGILLPKLFSVYIDDISDKLVKCKVGCYIYNLCMNHECMLMIFVYWSLVLQLCKN